jgi:hypothetical protein
VLVLVVVVPVVLPVPVPEPNTGSQLADVVPVTVLEPHVAEVGPVKLVALAVAFVVVTEALVVETVVPPMLALPLAEPVPVTDTVSVTVVLGAV